MLSIRLPFDHVSVQVRPQGQVTMYHPVRPSPVKVPAMTVQSVSVYLPILVLPLSSVIPSKIKSFLVIIVAVPPSFGKQASSISPLQVARESRKTKLPVPSSGLQSQPSEGAFSPVALFIAHTLARTKSSSARNKGYCFKLSTSIVQVVTNDIGIASSVSQFSRFLETHLLFAEANSTTYSSTLNLSFGAAFQPM